jgi:hypothetical protein
MTKKIENNEHNQTVMIETLKGGVSVDMTALLQKKYDFLKEAKEISQNTRDKEAKAFTEQVEIQTRILFKHFAEIMNGAFPNEKQISGASLGLLEDVLNRYKITVVVSKR